MKDAQIMQALVDTHAKIEKLRKIMIDLTSEMELLHKRLSNIEAHLVTLPTEKDLEENA